MAYLDPNYLNDAQFRSLYDEHYYQPTGIMALARASTPATKTSAPNGYISNQMEDYFKTSDSRRGNEFPVIQDQVITVNTTPGYGNIPDNLPDTYAQSYTAVDIFSGYTFYPDSYDNTDVDGVQERNMRTMKIFEAMGKAGESAVLAIMEQRKTQLLDFTTQTA